MQSNVDQDETAHEPSHHVQHFVVFIMFSHSMISILDRSAFTTAYTNDKRDNF